MFKWIEGHQKNKAKVLLQITFLTERTSVFNEFLLKFKFTPSVEEHGRKEMAWSEAEEYDAAAKLIHERSKCLWVALSENEILQKKIKIKRMKQVCVLEWNVFQQLLKFALEIVILL